MHKLLIIVLFFHVTVYAQDNQNVFQEVEESIEEGKDFFKNTTANFSPKELIGNILSEATEEKHPEDKIYFVNEKYYVAIDDGGGKTLGYYKFKIIKNIPVVILIGIHGERDTNYHGLVVKSNEGDYRVDWDHYYNYTYKISEQVAKDALFSITGESVYEFNFHNPDISFDILNSKIGIYLKGKKIIANVIDSLKIYNKLATVYHSGKTSMYNLNGKLLCSNLKSLYQYSYVYHQVIDSENQMFFIDTLGNKYKSPVERRTIWGNDTDANRITKYFAHKNKILKTTHKSYSLKRYKEPTNLDDFDGPNYMLYLLQEDILTFDKKKRWLSIKDIEDLVKKKNFEELFFLKKILKEEEYRDQLSLYLLSNITTTIIVLPDGMKKVVFVNNSPLEMSAEDYWYYNGFYKPLKPSYVIAKKRRAFGVWDIEEKKQIIPFEYNKILPKRGTHLLLERGNLKTYYPFIGITPKYKYLGDYIEYYARFEYPDGKKGWVDRTGVEYFDDIKRPNN